MRSRCVDGTCALFVWIITLTVSRSQPAVDPIEDVSPTVVAEMKDYLLKYGYGETDTNEQLRDAVIKLQKFMNLPPTGFINNATLTRLSWVRCKVKDPADRVQIGTKVPPYLHYRDESHWDDVSIYYNILTESSDEVLAAVERAVLGWVNTTPLSFRYNGDPSLMKIHIQIVSKPSDIQAIFGIDSNEFGQAFPPPDGTIRLNGGLGFSVTPEPSGIPLESVVMHEIGHALGLEHVPGPGSIMNPYYEIFYKYSQPQENDVAGIKYLYVTCPENETIVGDLKLTWPAAMKDSIAKSVEVCPSYSINAGKPLAFRYCRKIDERSAEWDSPTNYTSCLDGDPNGQAANLSKVVVNETNVVEIAGALVEVTNHTADVTPQGLDAVADTLSNIAAVKYPSKEVTSSVVATVNNILYVDSMYFDKTPHDDSPSRIIKSLETQVETLQLKGGNFSETWENIAVKAFNYPIDSLMSPLVFAKLMPSANESYAGLNERNTEVYYDPDEVPENDTETSIRLPIEIINRYRAERTSNLSSPESLTIPITFTIFGRHRIFVPFESDGYIPIPKVKENQEPSNGEDKTTTTSNGEDKTTTTHKCAARQPASVEGDIQGHVISAHVAGERVFELEEPVIMTFTSDSPDDLLEENEHLHCVYWNFDAGDWLTHACSLQEVKPNGQIVCACSHLTNFAVVLSPYDDAFSHVVFDIFNIVAVCLSIIGLLVTLIMYILIPKLNQQPSIQVHMNFMVSLLCLYIVFIIGIDMTHLPNGCLCVAILIHYFSLSTVFLMGAEAVTMYFLFVSVIGQQGGIKQIPYYVLKAAVVAWGVPLVVVIITVASSYCQYYNEDYCFLPTGNPLYFGEILPIGLILIANLIIFSLVTYRITRKRKFKQKANNNSKKKQKEMVRQFYRVLSLFTVLGLAWIFGILSSLYYARAVFQVLFSLTTALQGVFIFLLFCVRHHDVLETWKRWIRRAKGKPARDLERSGRGRSEIATTPRSPTSPVSTTVSPIALYPARSYASESS
ncbi:adhesion G-protein coupled receptor G7-like [Amphiura filiformis]|uniref:adhesion G-protein coupled receptor G7-like n=1 Tax=Amphiura filiformis TaxID=82378 RepID=UPI003B2251CE